MKLKLLIVSAVSFVFLNAQQLTGEIIYAHTQKIDAENLFKDNNDPILREAYIESLKKAFNKNYNLKFNAIESFFEEEKIISNDIQGQSRAPVRIEGFPSAYYFNLKDGLHIEEIEYFGKQFLVTEKIKKEEWKITEESKTIGQFYCIKAIKSIPVSDFQEKEYEEALKDYEKNSKSLLFAPQPPQPKEIVAWFTPEIPLPFGPIDQQGLPGIILELQIYNRIFLASKITLNPKKTIEIKKPTKGKVVSLKEYQVFEDEMANRNKKNKNQ